MRAKRTIGLLSAVCLLSGCAGPGQRRVPDPPEGLAQPADPLGAAEPESAAPEDRRPGLRHAYLYGADLKGADLQGVDLYRCQLGQADLSNADLRHASLSGAYLFKANLRGADLRGAKFSSALKGAELKQTGLAGARFDASTQLPFSEEEARRRGMIAVAPDNEVASNF